MSLRPISVLLACLFASQLVAATPAIFDNPRTVRLGAGFDPQPVQVADFDHDGELDFAYLDTADAHTAKLSVHRGNGDGTFREPVTTTFPTAPMHGVHVAAGELDGNSFPDLVVSFDVDTHTIFRTFLGNGDGTFTTGQQVDTDHFCRTNAFALGDMTGDGRPDLAICSVLLFPSTGGGNFGAPIASDAPSGDELRVLDANGDGKRDLLLSSSLSYLVLGNGDGTFRPAELVDAGVSAVADFDGNGRDDLTWIDPYRGDRGVMLASPDGTYPERRTAGYVTDSREAAIVTADLNGDARPDVLVGFGAHVYVSLTLPDGTSAEPKIYLAGSGALYLVTGDFDSDGKIDVLATGQSEWRDFNPSASVALLRGGGDGTLRAERAYALPHPIHDGRFVDLPTVGLTTSDITGDGWADLVVVTEQNVNVLPGQADGTFGAAVTTPLPADLAPRASFGDLNGDGAIDIVLLFNQGLRSAPNVQAWLANRDGTFRTNDVATTALASEEPAIGDFDGDGALDLALVASYGAYFYRGRGDGTFGAVAFTPGSLESGAVRVADLNGDGADDLAGFGWTLLGLAKGTFTTAHQDFHLLPLLADLDADGSAEMIVGELVSNRGFVHVAPGVGDGTFEQGRQLTLDTRGSFGPSVAADFDGDGDLDVAFGATVFLGDGAGWFNGYARFRLQDEIEAVAAGDVDRNGSDDLLVACALTDTIDVVRTRTTTSRELPLSLELTSPPTFTPSLGSFFDVNVTANHASSFTPGGAVLFFFRDQLTAVGELDGGTARGQLQTLLAGSHPYSATYGGDELYAATATPVRGTIAVSRGTIDLEAGVNPTPPRVGDPLRIYAQALRALQQPVPAGPLTVVIDNVLVGTGAMPLLDLPVGALSQGLHRVLIEYPGDANYEPAFSAFSFIVEKQGQPRRRASGKP